MSQLTLRDHSPRLRFTQVFHVVLIVLRCIAGPCAAGPPLDIVAPLLPPLPDTVRPYTRSLVSSTLTMCS